MDTHAIYEGAMRLLAARQRLRPDWLVGATDKEIESAVDCSLRTWQAAINAVPKPVTREVPNVG